MRRMDVRQQPRQYGEGASMEPEKALGDLEVEQAPQPGEHLEMRGETWVVTRVHHDAIYVTPLGDA